jgi:hypothetical protein
MPDIAASLSRLAPRRDRAPWPGREYVKGWGVFGLPFDSGHVLALRVFPESDFGGYTTVWHRTPDLSWSIHVDGPRLDTACPRYYGSACSHTGFAKIDVSWTGPASLRVAIDEPRVDWTVTAHSTPLLSMLNPISSALPLATWKPRPLVRARELMAAGLGLGDLALTGVMPSGHFGRLMPQRMYLIDDSSATIGGVDLGRPTRVRPNPTIGGVPLPARGVLAIGMAMWDVLDTAEYERTRSECAAAAP